RGVGLFCILVMTQRRRVRIVGVSRGQGHGHGRDWLRTLMWYVRIVLVRISHSHLPRWQIVCRIGRNLGIAWRYGIFHRLFGSREFFRRRWDGIDRLGLWRLRLRDDFRERARI